MSSAKIIENPEVPGLECFLPPPPPPPPPPIASTKNEVVPSTTKHRVSPTVEVSTTAPTTAVTAANPTSIQAPVASFPSVPVGSSYILHPAVQPQTPGQPPWWVPVDSDTSEIYAQWYDTTYKATAATMSSPTSLPSAKAKSKYYKRKSEFIDPAQDAEKVASAQRELSALMKPLNCDLCNAVMNSTLQAKLHYDGKPHQKKVSMFLNQSVKKQKTEDGQVSSTTNDWQNYCDICKTWFTSQMDATQHYAGKKHIRAANGGRRSRPSKKSVTQNQYGQIDSTGLFGIGLSFHLEVQATPTQPVVVDGTPPPTPGLVPTPSTTPNPASVPSTGTIYTPPPYPTPLRCDLCGVSANRQDQLETHKRGARHLRMLRMNGLPVPEAVSENESTPTVPGPIDYSIYRTPSGQYYCAPCNLSLNSESTFAQHVESKKHKNQSNPKSPSNSVTVSKKARFKKK